MTLYFFSAMPNSDTRSSLVSRYVETFLDGWRIELKVMHFLLTVHILLVEGFNHILTMSVFE